MLCRTAQRAPKFRVGRARAGRPACGGAHEDKGRAGNGLPLGCPDLAARESRGRVSLLQRLVRTLLTLAAVLPGIATGLLVLLLRRDRRTAMNRAIGTWGRLGLRAAGIRLEVRGAAHLEMARPCVFLLNHQSGVDPILICALLRRDFVGVAKRELRRNPLLGPAFAFAGTVFVDRLDHEQAVRSLSPAVETLRAGLSIAIAPEGTRGQGGALAPFKKGGFRLAMQAGVPIVPVVILNSQDVLPGGNWLMRPGCVSVVVHPAIDTQGWALPDLDAQVARVHDLYRATLAAGPGASPPSLQD